MTSRSIFILFSLSLGFAHADTACKGPVPPPSVIADDVKVDVTAACTTVSAVVQDVVVSLVCATVEETAALAELIAKQTGHVASEDGGVKITCVTAQKQTLCATPDRMAAAIKIMNARRINGVDGGQK